MAINVLITTHIYLLAEGISRLIEDSSEIKVIDIVSPPQDLKNMIEPELDIIIADHYSFQCLSPMNDNGETRKILLISCQQFPTEDHDLQQMISRGVVGIIQTNTDFKQLKKAITKVHCDELWFDHQHIRNTLCRHKEKASLIHITRKETQTLHHICNGLTNREIAAKMCICEQTVKTHCYHLFKKFGVSNRVKLALQVATDPNRHFITPH